MKKLKVLSLFDGISCGMVALERAGLDVEKYISYEIEENAIKVSKYNYPQIIQKGDVFEATYNEGEFDLLIGGSPCFTGDTLVLTDYGYKNIIDVKVGDMVLGHNNKYNEVLNFMNQGKKEIWKLKSMVCDEINTTENHKFYVRKRYRQWDNDKRRNVRLFEDPEWMECKKLTKDYYVGTSINQKSIIPKWEGVEYNGENSKYIKNTLDMNDDLLWYICGRYIGDGWIRRRKERNNNISGFIICCGKHEVEKFENKIGKKYHYTRVEDRTTFKYQFSNRELGEFLSKFGCGAKNKFIPGFVLDLPKEKLAKLLEGYFDADGCYLKDGKITSSSISKKLTYSIGQCVAKVYNRPFSIHKSVRKPHKIEGRQINQSPSYVLTFCPYNRKQDYAFYENGYVWSPINSVENTNSIENVYDIEVKDSHSFIANSMIVHNCTHWSIAKAGGYRETTSSGIGWELFMQYVRALKEVKPKYFLYENNESMSDDIKNEITKQLGVEPIMINSADFSAQIRKRYYWTNIPVDLNYEKSSLVLSDILYEHDFKIKDFSKYKDTVKWNKDKTVCKWDTSGKGYYSQASRCRKTNIKSNTLTASGNDKNNIWLEDCKCRVLHPIEAERLQTLPDNYTECLTSKVKRSEVCGNGWTVDVIVHILRGLIV